MIQTIILSNPVFGRNPFRISSTTATVLNETFRGTSQSFQDSAVGIANTQQDILPDVGIPLRENSFCFLESVQNSSRPTQPSVQWVTSLRTREAVILFHLRAFVEWKEKCRKSTSKRLLPCSSSLFLIYYSLSFTYSMPHSEL